MFKTYSTHDSLIHYGVFCYILLHFQKSQDSENGFPRRGDPRWANKAFKYVINYLIMYLFKYLFKYVFMYLNI